MQFDYEKSPLLIEQESFRIIRELTDLARFNEQEQQIAMRLVHTCGDPAVVNELRLSAGALHKGLTALQTGAEILCDVEMVRYGLTRRLLSNSAKCFLNESDVADLAKATGDTRSMSAVELWKPWLQDNIVLIGNAPTALFRLLEIMRDGGGKPALIIGMPVGFVGAAESKEALWRYCSELGSECITLLGRQGGSALTASAFNALLRIRHGISF